jgi:hypothetical protein
MVTSSEGPVGSELEGELARLLRAALVGDRELASKLAGSGSGAIASSVHAAAVLGDARGLIERLDARPEQLDLGSVDLVPERTYDAHLPLCAHSRPVCHAL